jgi:hypothetical protein
VLRLVFLRRRGRRLRWRRGSFGRCGGARGRNLGWKCLVGVKGGRGSRGLRSVAERSLYLDAIPFNHLESLQKAQSIPYR